MNRKFEVIFLEDVVDFLQKLDEKAREKVIYNIDKATYVNDPKLFKKLNDHIWEFRTIYKKTQYRILAFWDKNDKTETLVLTTHGFIKKTQKTPKSELEKAEKIRSLYLKENK
ncbi:MAG: type II toxin-antitoxin system RelE/ParE family toxin [Crocinitomicaceae bacterium]|nr:type II toxin-antitoxin system RelE/ParE family toxin [Crocinitomicaceae bacterium]MCB0838357.1 type II toxin-antitoxin system RelE/ParE family toxin [Bacteroidota bacterium]